MTAHRHRWVNQQTDDGVVAVCAGCQRTREEQIVMAIDPGPERSAWVIYESVGRVRSFALAPNETLLSLLQGGVSLGAGRVVDRLVIEKVESFGMPVGAEIFETVFWTGRFAEAAFPLPVDRIGRMAVKLHLCGTARAKDANIRAALIDRFGGEKAIGRKASPGPLYGITGDVWAALAVAVTYCEAGE